MSGSNPQQTSVNFAFLAKHDRHLAGMAGFAELYSSSDPNTSLVKQRQLIERLAQLAAARFGVDGAPDLRGLIDELYHRRLIQPEVAQTFHYVRREGNRANHEMTGTTGEAVHALKRCRMLAAWYFRTFVERGFKPGPFVAPQPPEDPSVGLQAQVAEQQARIAELRERTADAEEKAALEEQQRRAAEAENRVREDDVEAALALLDESEQEKERYQQRLAGYQARAMASTEGDRRQISERAKEATSLVDLDEAATRELIDADLRATGWQADSRRLTHARGARPQKGKYLAIAEWPTVSGPADYVLFHGLVPLATVEAKRRRKSARAAIGQAKRYSRDFEMVGDLLTPGGPWGVTPEGGDQKAHRVPFLFATNGRPFLREVLEESGIWFLDARRPTNHPRALEGWYTPQGLWDLLRLDAEAADRELEATPADYLPLRDYQVAAVRAVESAVAMGRREILVAMATGTGKTRTTIGLLYRLIKAGRFRRALFVVDRSALGEQAGDAFGDVTLEAGQSFARIYDLKRLGGVEPEPDTRVQIATVQSLVRRVLYGEEPLPVDAYDCIVIDECHRGYTLDREMGDELAFRSQADYVSKYRRVLDHFDAVKIGLTATPALHTTEIFGDPVYQYSYRRAVIDGFLVDHEPPVRIETRLARDGIHWDVGEPVKVYDAGKGQIDLFHTPDEIDVEVENFNRTVITEKFNRAVCGDLAQHIDPRLPGKTLVFCVDDRHATLFVRRLKEAFVKHHGEIDDDAVQRITGSVDRPLERIRHFKNEALPSVAVTVDLLTTGIDVPEITQVVFMRRVRSRILYEQMLGRATRLCHDLYGRGEDKEVFKIYDAVDLYATLQEHSDMKPVVVNPRESYRDLVQDLTAITDPGARGRVLDQIVAKLQRQRRRIEEHHAERFEAAAGVDAATLIDSLQHMTPDDAAAYFRDHDRLAGLLDHLPSRDRKTLVSDHDDEVVAVTRGYGKDQQRPEDYLESFGRFLAESGNRLPALVVVTQRPRELTRQQLKALEVALDEAGYGERQLQSAWREWKNEDVAAKVIGFIRQRALGDPLEPYAERVDAAVKRLLANRDWTGVQRQWLERIGKQMKLETIVDREALNRGEFKNRGGGFDRFNRLFDGRIEEVLGDLHEGVWSA